MNQTGANCWPSTSPDLLWRIRRSADSSAWRRFSSQYSAVIHQFCVNRGLQHADAEDVVQQVLLAVSRQIAEFQYAPERAKFRTWLGTLLIRAVWKTRKKAQASREILCDPLEDWDTADPNGWTEHFGVAVFDVALHKIRPEFSDEEWSAFERTWRNHEPNEAVADDLQRPIGWIYQARFRILKRLRQQVGILAEDIAGPPECSV